MPCDGSGPRRPASRSPADDGEEGDLGASLFEAPWRAVEEGALSADGMPGYEEDDPLNARFPVPDWLVEAVRPRTAAPPWPRMLRMPMAICVPLGVGFAMGDLRMSLPVAMRSLADHDGRRTVANLLQAVLDAVDPEVGGDLKLLDLRLDLTADPAAVQEIEQHAEEAGATWGEEDLDSTILVRRSRSGVAVSDDHIADRRMWRRCGDPPRKGGYSPPGTCSLTSS